IALSSNPSKLSLSSKFTPKPFVKLHPNSSLPTKLKQLPSFKILSSLSQPAPPPPNSNLTAPKTLNLVSLLRAILDWADRIQERGMQQNRGLYNHEKWVRHRSSLRHLRHVLSSLQSRVILSLVPPVLAFTSVAVVIASYNTAADLHWLPGFFPVLRASSLPYQLTVPALALLLVFRTEASYSRFEEGRKAWTKVIAGTNDFASQVIAWVENSSDESIKSALLHYIMAFPVALKCHVMCGSDVGRDLQNLLEVDDLAVVLNSKHRPRCIIEFISQSLEVLNLEESKRTMSRRSHVSMKELVYVKNSRVGVLIEEPFPMLALDELCSVVQKNIKEEIATEKAIQARLNGKRKRHSYKHSPNGWPNT
ncbi:UPF0187 protein At3g61320, chloroplastic-like, partial [Durio zibethinus]|uniref:UPF0187 protein At3g61320, chloroplastic-like n=1 Tax=Durio zibethinus TaxID=66656 RepID=A0A6P5ZXQ2_DURZI